VIEIPQKGESL